MTEKSITVAIAGNPNCGKTCLFNNLTGAHQRVGNWPGVTVEQKRGTCVFNETRIDVIDLPGTYSLSAYSVEEEVVEAYIHNTPPDVLINIVDATNLERHLMLTAQLIETGVPMILVLNMMDEAESDGYDIDIGLLSEMLDMPVVPMVARRNKGTRTLLNTIRIQAEKATPPHTRYSYGPEIEEAMTTLEELLGPRVHQRDHFRYLRILHGGWYASMGIPEPEIQQKCDAIRATLEKQLGDRMQSVLYSKWYGLAHGVTRSCVSRTRVARRQLTERLDSVLTHPFFGLVAFAICMWATFALVFTLGAPLMELIEHANNWLGDAVGALLPDGYFRSLVVDGVIAGVGGVMEFLPNILLLFLAIGFLEDTGYLARAAFVTDKIMHRLGLHGKSFIPMLVGFGCTVPAIMSTRSLDTRQQRLVTALIVPFMSCAARLPVYMLFISAFFASRWHTPLLFSLYFLGIFVAIISANIIGFFFLGKDEHPLLMELPPYRLPTLRSVIMLMWMRTYMFLKKAGTLILLISIIMWGLLTFPGMDASREEHLRARHPDPTISAESLHIEHSYGGRIGKAIEPFFRPLHFDWKVSLSLVTGLAAKEVIVATMGVIYGLGDDVDEETDELKSVLRSDKVFRDNPFAALAFMVFVLLYIPCFATVVVFYREFALKWTVFLLVYTTAIAWLGAYMVTLVGKFFV